MKWSWIRSYRIWTDILTEFNIKNAKMKKFILSAVALIFCSFTSAQDADRMMSALVRTIEDKGISCEAEITVPGSDETLRATLIMKGEHWFMQTPEVAFWYDGETEWNGIVEDGKVIEVMVSDPSPEDQVSSNPFLLIRHHEGFSVSSPDSKTLVLTAIDRKKGAYAGILDVRVSFGNDGRPTLITMKSRDLKDGDIRMKIVRYETGTAKESDFKFSKAKWPDAQIIDLR